MDGFNEISKEDFYQKFNQLWSTFSISFLKHEGLNYYEEGTSSPYYKYISGDMDNFIEKLIEGNESRRESHRKFLDNGIKLQRIHTIDFPITPYLEYEYYSYIISEKLGQSINYIETSKAVDINGYKLNDFTCFDEKHMFIMDFDIKGNFERVFYSDNDKSIKSILDAYRRLLENSHDYKGYFNPPNTLVEKIKNDFDF